MRTWHTLTFVILFACLTGCIPAATTESSPEERRRIASSIYETYRKRDTIAWYKEFIANYPDSPYVVDAQNRIAELEAEPEKQREKEMAEDERRKQEQLYFCALVPEDKQRRCCTNRQS